MTPREYQGEFSRLGVNVDLRNLSGFPMLFERTERLCTETNPAHGGYTNARDLARLYSALLAALADREGRMLRRRRHCSCSVRRLDPRLTT